MVKRALAIAAVCALGGLLVATTPASADPPPSQVGQWAPPISEGGPTFKPSSNAESALYPTAVSAVVLPNGKVVYWNGLEGTESLQRPVALELPDPSTSKSRVLDLTGPSWTTPTPEDGGGGDLFCADQRHLADGRVLAVGGTEWVNDDAALGLPDGIGRTELYGLKSARIFNPETNSWTQAASMHYRRWYPTLITLPDGRLLVSGGVEKLVYNDKGTNVAQTEIYDPVANTWTENGTSGEVSLPLFARMHLLPNGKVLYDATGQMWSPAGAAVDEAVWNFHKLYTPPAPGQSGGSWEMAGAATFGARSGAFSAMLPLVPDASGNYTSADILIGGGNLGTSPGSYVANPISEVVSWASPPAGCIGPCPEITRVVKLPMNNPRWYSSAVVLPSGEVIALSGADRDEVVDPGSEIPVREAEIWDPSQEKWVRLSSAARERTYHNSAVLLADGRILVGGHSPIVAHYGAGHSSHGSPFANNFKDPSFEIFEPPYLFRGARPEFSESWSPPSSITRGSTVTIDTPDAASTSLKVVLAKLPATTHITDADQRTVWVNHSYSGGTSISVTIPSSAAVLPGGHYYLFLLKDNGQGLTPSVAKVIKIAV